MRTQLSSLQERIPWEMRWQILWKDVSIGRDYKTESAVNATDLPVCDEYEYGGTGEHLKEIEEAERQGKIYLKV